MDWMITIFVAFSAHASEVEAGSIPSSYVLCKTHSTVRTIRIDKDKLGLCRTIYTKDGVDQIVGSARQKDSCESYLKNIKTNLESAQWKCRRIATSEILGPKEHM